MQIAHVIVVIDDLLDLPVELLDASAQVRQHRLQALARKGAGGAGELILMGGACVDELGSTHQQLGEFLVIGGLFLQQSRSGELCELHQHACVDGIGFGQLTDAIGKQSHPFGIDPRHRQLCRYQRHH